MSHQHPTPESATVADPERIKIEIRPEQAEIIARDHRQMESAIARVRADFRRSLELLSAGSVPPGASFFGMESGPDGVPLLVFDAPPA